MRSLGSVGAVEREAGKVTRSLIEQLGRELKRLENQLRTDIAAIEAGTGTSTPTTSVTLSDSAASNVDLAVGASGSGSTASRWDHKHDLAEDISPTWTGTHNWNGNAIKPNNGLHIEPSGTAGAFQAYIDSSQQDASTPGHVDRTSFYLRGLESATNLFILADAFGVVRFKIPFVGQAQFVDESNNLTDVVLESRTVTAGDGLIGGGSLASNITLEVGAGTGITVAENSVAIASGYLGANPSASVGLTAVNGSSTNYMRADGAPALSQSIAPTWTGTHTFSLESVHNGGVDVGTSGRLDSNVADASGAINFLIKPSTSLSLLDTRGILSVQTQGGVTGLHVWSDGKVEIGGASGVGTDGMMMVSVASYCPSSPVAPPGFTRAAGRRPPDPWPTASWLRPSRSERMVAPWERGRRNRRSCPALRREYSCSCSWRPSPQGWLRQWPRTKWAIARLTPPTDRELAKEAAAAFISRVTTTS